MTLIKNTLKLKTVSALVVHVFVLALGAEAQSVRIDDECFQFGGDSNAMSVFFGIKCLHCSPDSKGGACLPMNDNTTEHKFIADSGFYEHSHLEVAGVNDEDAEDEVQSNPDEEPFALYDDFNIENMITGDEDWDELIEYRRTLERPSLSFYIDKVARKRWLPAMGYSQSHLFALKYAHELTSSGDFGDEKMAIQNLVPKGADFAAKPTHFSSLEGVWLVRDNVDEEVTYFSNSGRELTGDRDFDERQLVHSLADHLHHEADKAGGLDFEESWALRHVKPGIVIEELYTDVHDKNMPPMEFNVFTIWGRLWIAQMNAVRGQNRWNAGFLDRNGAPLPGQSGNLPDWVDWAELVSIAESLGAHKDMFRTDVFVGVPASAPAAKVGGTREERIAAINIAVSECEIYPTTIFWDKNICNEGARLWIAGYKKGNYRSVPNTEVPQDFLEHGHCTLPGCGLLALGANAQLNGNGTITRKLEHRMQSKLAFLEAYHADEIVVRPSNSSFMEHLRGDSNLLQAWGLPAHVQDAGLFHSVYGTEDSTQQAVPDIDRVLVRELIGDEAEALVWIFGNMHLQDFYQQVKRLVAEKNMEGFILPCRMRGDIARASSNQEALSSTPANSSDEGEGSPTCNVEDNDKEQCEDYGKVCELHLSRQQARELAAITLANLLQQAPNYSDLEMQSWSRNELAFMRYLFLPVLPEKAGVDVEQYLTRTTTERKNTNPFVRMENDLRNLKYGNPMTDFNFRIYNNQSLQDQLPKSLSVPDFVRVFELEPQDWAPKSSLTKLGKWARNIIDANLDSSGAVLIRNLQHDIANASDFKRFWVSVMEPDQDNEAWKYHTYNGAYNSYRTQLDSVDVANSIPPHVLLRLHNEHAMNPTTLSRIGFYCLRSAVGGKTMLGLNSELTERIQEGVKPFLEAHGGLRSDRYYWNDPEGRDPLSWQAKTGASTREAAASFFIDRGWNEVDISFDEHNGMSVKNVKRGYIVDRETGQDLWYNMQHNIAGPMADGTEMPEDMVRSLELAMWNSAHAFQLREGDWLILDNLRVMHGRYPFENISPEDPRTLLVVYTD